MRAVASGSEIKYPSSSPFPTRSDSRTSVQQQKTPTASPVMEKPRVASENTDKASRDENLRKLLANPLASSWPYTESSLIHAINLKLEQEKTKQEYYKLENLNRSLELLRQSILARVPPNLIPLIFAGQNISQEAVDSIVQSQQRPFPAQPQVQQSQPQVQSHQQSQPGPAVRHERSRTLGTPYEEVSTPPMPTNFKFGGGSSGEKSEFVTPSSARQNPPVHVQHQQQMDSPLRAKLQHARQLSPAKIGALAVASLNNRFKSTTHARTTSLPPQVSIPETSAVSFHREDKQESPKLPVVRTPNQPVILQHQLIQFHHWTPSDSESTPGKRRRSDEEIDEKFGSESPESSERRKFITTHTRTRSDTSLIQTNDSSGRMDSNPPKYPNILSE